MKVLPLLALNVFIGFTLAACGGGDESTVNSGSGTFTGKVVDGYIQGSVVCLDLNLNNNCDTGEPSTTVSGNGSYILRYGSDVVIENVPVVIQFPLAAVDQNDRPSIFRTGETKQIEY